MVVINIIKVVEASYLHIASRESLEGRAASACRCRKLGLDEDLLHAILLLVEHVVNLFEVLDVDTVGHHLQGIDLALLDHLQKLLPVEVDGCLSVADKADTTLHQRANVEVVGLW